MRIRDLKNQSIEQLHQSSDAIKSDLLRFVSTAAASSGNARRRRESRRDLARVLTLLGQK